MADAPVLTFYQTLLSLWLSGAYLRRVGDELEIEHPPGSMSPELEDGIRQNKLRLLKLVTPRRETLRLPADLYWRVLWAPRPEWRYPYRVVH